MTEFVLKVEETELRNTFNEVIVKQVTALLKNTISTNEIAEIIRKGFEKKWTDNRDVWFQDRISDAFERAMNIAIEKAFETSQMNELLEQEISKYVTSDEFKENMKKRAIETVNKTVFNVKVEELSN